MSLTDALLLEGYRDPRDVWIALRVDGQRGSGSVDDPFHGGVVEAAPISAALSFDATADSRLITVTTAAPHGFIEGDIVALSDTRDAAGVPQLGYNGPYQITFAGLTETQSTRQFKCYLDFPGTGSLTGMASAAKRIFLLDQLFRSLTQQYMVFHFGPGVFETRGNAGGVNTAYQGWEPREGWKFRGSGMNVTTIKLASSRGGQNKQCYLAIGPQTWYMPAHYSEASDLTIDCNAAGNRTLTVGAIQLTGSHTRLRRIRAINWGPQAGPESFVITLGGNHPALPEVLDCVIEDCIANQPGLNNTHETTIFGIAGTPAVTLDEKPSFVRGGILRRNVVDCTYSRNEVPIESIVVSGGKAVVTTAMPHGRADGDYVVIAGAIVDGTELNTFNGSYQISNRTDTTFEYTPNPSAPASNPVGNMFVDRFSNHWVPGASSPPCLTDQGNNKFKLTTLAPHNRIPGNNVVINGVYVSGLNYDNGFNGAHLIDEVLSPAELTFTVDPAVIGTIDWNLTQLYIGVQFHVGAGGGVCHAVEHNRIIGAINAVYADSFSGHDLHIRNNYFHRVLRGVYRNIQGYLSPPGPIQGSCLTHSCEGGQHTATFTTIDPHGLTTADAVTIGGASVVSQFGYAYNPYSSSTDQSQGENWNPDNPYNGTFPVSAVLSSNQFKYVLPRPPGLGNSNRNYNPELVPSNAAGSPVFAKNGPLNVVTAESLGPLTAGSKTARFVTPAMAPHGLQTGDIVSVFGVKMGPPTDTPFFNPYNGVFEIKKVNETEFTYLMNSAPSADALTNPIPTCAKQLGTALTRNGAVATFRTVSPHFLTAGQIIRIDGALVGGLRSNPFNGVNFALTSIGTSSFSYEMSSVPTTAAYGPAGYAGKDTEGLLQIENNVMDLITTGSLFPSTFNPAIFGGLGVVMSAWANYLPNYIFREVLVRDNLIRNPDNGAESPEWATAVSCSNCGALLVENNVITSNTTAPVTFYQSTMVSALSNRVPQGTVINAQDSATGQFVDAYSPVAEDALVLAML